MKIKNERFFICLSSIGSKTSNWVVLNKSCINIDSHSRVASFPEKHITNIQPEGHIFFQFFVNFWLILNNNVSQIFVQHLTYTIEKIWTSISRVVMLYTIAVDCIFILIDLKSIQYAYIIVKYDNIIYSEIKIWFIFNSWLQILYSLVNYKDSKTVNIILFAS